MKESKLVEQLIYPRYIGWLLRIILTFFAADTFGLDITSALLIPFLVFELVYLAASHHFFLKSNKFNERLFLLLLLDNSFWIIWLSLTGGATNAFISSLLIPIAIASIALPSWNAIAINIINCSAYSLMLYLKEETGHMAHMDMGAHYIGMWLNFILSALVINVSLTLISQKLRKREKQLSSLRESQLRQEQIVALGASSAQMAHQLATPLCSMRLWLEELKDEQSEQAIEELNNSLTRCEHSLQELRLATDAIRDGKVHSVSVKTFIGDVQQKTQLLLPAVEANWSYGTMTHETINVDQGVLPAILTLIDNAQKASITGIKAPKVDISSRTDEQYLYIDIRDFGLGISDTVKSNLGKRFIKSSSGLGVALALTHASLDRNGGQLTLEQHPENGCIASVRYPLSTDE
ncbi:HAMP domain-containing histidine kinase [Shewanella sp. 202IG2-18]|uniref:sensor histidine kinase n=1 Tax=Parashewanella hymeniacidonis TaxID=2807618 RepID=UPI00196164A4|nr:HAMP domain-containing sensor histidine kinase [Parashewanella hymeniacidonis]MBM7073428.1 HAMP domain-containing histidine kinase [Parashewanella hymeniacidonis]